MGGVLTTQVVEDAIARIPFRRRHRPKNACAAGWRHSEVGYTISIAIASPRLTSDFTVWATRANVWTPVWTATCRDRPGRGSQNAWTTESPS
jgi:hypothetical protein